MSEPTTVIAANVPPVSNIADTTPLTPSSLRLIAGKGFLNQTQYNASLEFMGIRPGIPAWLNYWLRILLTLGLLLFVAGVICFFAYNWAAISHFFKFGLIIALMLICTLVSIWRGLNSVSGSLAMLAAGLLAGPLLAVYGQYYQTGADAWELFFAWTLFLIPLALLGRQNGLWVAAWLIGSICAGLYLHQNYVAGWRDGGFFTALNFKSFLTGQLLALILWEAALYWGHKRPQSFLHSPWPARLTGFALLFLLTQLNSYNILIASDTWWYRDGYHNAGFASLMYVAVTAGGFCWYRFKRPDTLMLTLGFFSIITLFFTWLLSTLDVFNAGGMLLMAVLLAASAIGAAALILHWHRDSLKRHLSPGNVLQDMKRQLIYLRTVTLDELFRHLELDEKPYLNTLLEKDDSHLMPWYLSIMLTVSAWVSAIFLIGFIGFIMFENVRGSEEMILLTFAVICLVAAGLLTRSDKLFLRQFGLAVGLAGGITLPIAIVVTIEMDYWWQFPILLSAVLCFILIRHQAMRSIATFVILLELTDFICLFLQAFFENSGFYGDNIPDIIVFHGIMAVAAVLFALLAVCVLKFWQNEGRWVTRRRLDNFYRPALLGVTVFFLFMGGSWAAYSPGHYSLFDVWGLYARSGYMLTSFKYGCLGISLSLVWLAWNLLKKRRDFTKTQKGFVYGAAILVVAASWWLPWLGVAVWLLTLSRYLGNLALSGLSAAYLSACVIWYYYSMHVTLLHKSYILLAAGLIMLLVSYAIHRLFGAGLMMTVAVEGGDHA